MSLLSPRATARGSTFRFVVLALAALAIAGCGASEGAETPPASTDAGTIVPAADSGAVDARAPEPPCEPGTARAAKECVPCAAGSFSDVADAVSCRPWTDCAAGTFVSHEGSATQDRGCAACSAGTYASGPNAGACVSWSDCGPGTYVSSAGSASQDRQCAACGVGSYASGMNAAACVAWSDCVPGTYVSSAGSATQDRQCASCGVGTHAPRTNAAACVAWSDCGPGQYVAVAGSMSQDRQCAACGAGSFAAGTNAAACALWTTCSPGQFVSRAATATQDRQCTSCVAGSYATGTNAAACASWSDCGPGQYVAVAGSATQDRQCTSCAAGSFAVGTNAAACALWTTCSPGQFVSRAGTGSADRACMACVSGSYSLSANSSACSACPPGTSSGPGATTCSSGNELTATTASMTGPGLSDCGPAANDVCARSVLVPGGSFLRGSDASAPATVSTFRLDKYEVTVGRFRKFVNAWLSGWRPSSGSGKHRHLRGQSGLLTTSGQPESGWDPLWSPMVSAHWSTSPSGVATPSLPAWTSVLTTDEGNGDPDPFATWTQVAGVRERRPQTNLSWLDLHAFCIWDGGFLPTEAEWEYAASGGADERVYPWGVDSPTEARASYWIDWVRQCGGDGIDGCSIDDLIPVGTKPAGNGRWGHADLAGNVAEWVRDAYSDTLSSSCVDCFVDEPDPPWRMTRGGTFENEATELGAAVRGWRAGAFRVNAVGGRCARTP